MSGEVDARAIISAGHRIVAGFRTWPEPSERLRPDDVVLLETCGDVRGHLGIVIAVLRVVDACGGSPAVRDMLRTAVALAAYEQAVNHAGCGDKAAADWWRDEA